MTILQLLPRKPKLSWVHAMKLDSMKAWRNFKCIRWRQKIIPPIDADSEYFEHP